MKTWLRVTLPHDGVIIGVLIVYGLLEITFLPFEGIGPRGPVVRHVADLVLVAAALFYGVYRGIAFNPLFNSEYRVWLSRTPWTSRYPLPAGPVLLALQDVFYVGALAGIAWWRHPAVEPYWLALAFLFGYELAMAAGFSRLKMAWDAYAIGFSLGIVALLWLSPLWSLTAVAIVYSISSLGLRRALDNFANWQLDHDESQQLFSRIGDRNANRGQPNQLGWPFDYLAPNNSIPSIRYRDGILLSLLAGWWFYVALQLSNGWQIDREFWFVFVYPVFGSFLYRLWLYCWGYAAPISLSGRLLTGRWIIPGYDVVLIAPAAILAIAGCGTWLHLHEIVPARTNAPLTLTLVFLIALNGGPTLRRWRLTGRFRMSPAFLARSNSANLTEV